MKRALVTTGLVAVGLALAIVVFGNPLRAEDLPVLPTGQAAPDFEVTDEDGNLHKLSDYAGKAVVIEWTNPDCPFVKRHYDSGTMEDLAASLEVEEVVWLAANSTRSNKPEDTRAWKQRQGFSYATLQDADGTLGRSYGARTTPHMFVIDGAGVLQYNGAIDDDPKGRASQPVNYVRAAVQSVKAGAKPDPSQTEPYGCSVKYK